MSASLRASACLLLASAGVAHAQAIGYVETFGGSTSSAVSYNSVGGGNSLNVLGTGSYQVVLSRLGNALNSNVQVNAVNTNGTGHYCTSAGWYSPNGTDVAADVRCFDGAGTPLNADFALFYQARPSANPAYATAFLWADQPTAPKLQAYTPSSTYSYNSTGGINTVTHGNPGVYQAFLPGFTVSGGNPQATAYGSTAARCEIAALFHNRVGTTVSVYCVNAAGQGADSSFNLSYTYHTSEASDDVATDLGVYAWANNASSHNYTPNRTYQWDAVSPLVTAQRFGGAVQGQYSLTVANPAGSPFKTILGMVTAAGTSGEYCNPAGTNVFSDSFYMDLICYNAAGQQMDTTYYGTLITSQ